MMEFVPLEERQNRAAATHLGEDIRLWREIRTLTRAQLSERAKVSESTISRLEKGDQGVSIGALIAIVRVLRIPHFLESASPFESEEGQRLMTTALKR